jgi:hypothetical protein
VSTGSRANIIPSSRNNERYTKVNVNLFAGEALSSNITLTLHPYQANAEGDLKATPGTNVEWAGFTWKEVKFSATE